MESNLGIKGKFRIENVTTGQIVESYNTIHNVGLSSIIGLLGSPSVGSPFVYIAIGTGSSTIDATDTSLGTETLRQEADSNTIVTTTVTNDTLRLIGSFTGDTYETLNEIAIFNASGLNLGSMIARGVFADTNVSGGDLINTTYDIIGA